MKIPRELIMYNHIFLVKGRHEFHEFCDILVEGKSPIKREASPSLLSKIIWHSWGTGTNSKEITLNFL